MQLNNALLILLSWPRYLCSSILKPKWMISFLLLLYFILLISSPFNQFATKTKSVIILVFPQQADLAYLKLMDWNSVPTFSHYNDTIFWSFSLVHISHYKFIITNFHEFLYTMSEMYSDLHPYFLVVCTFSHSFTSCNMNLVCCAYTYSFMWADTLESNKISLWMFLVLWFVLGLHWWFIFPPHINNV